jgi:hypothetical protein
MGFVRLSKTLIAVIDIELSLTLIGNGHILHSTIHPILLLIPILRLLLLRRILAELCFNLLILWPLRVLGLLVDGLISSSVLLKLLVVGLVTLEDVVGFVVWIDRALAVVLRIA